MKNNTNWRSRDFDPELPVFVVARRENFNYGRIRIVVNFDAGVAELMNEHGEIAGILGTGSARTVYAPLTKAAREFVKMVEEAAS